MANKKRGLWYKIFGDEEVAQLARAILIMFAFGLAFFLLNFIPYQIFGG